MVPIGGVSQIRNHLKNHISYENVMLSLSKHLVLKEKTLRQAQGDTKDIFEMASCNIRSLPIAIGTLLVTMQL